MGPHDLLCKWCSTFVGKGKKFCSIFCESRYTRSKRRKLAFRRPVYSSGSYPDKEYESPRSNKTAPARKETFLEDVITAIENEKPSPERDKHRPEGDTNAHSLPSDRVDNSANGEKKDTPSKVVPKLDLSMVAKDKKGVNENTKSSARDKLESQLIKDKSKTDKDVQEKKEANRNKSAARPKDIMSKEMRSKTQTLLVHKYESKIPVRAKPSMYNQGDELGRTDHIKKSNTADDSLRTTLRPNRLTNTHDKGKLETEKEDTDVSIYNQAVQRQKSKTITGLEKIRSSGYGNPMNPRLRPMALKPRSATMSSSVTTRKRESSARSTKSSTLEITSFSHDDSRPIASDRHKAKWELIATTITEENTKTENTNGNTSLEDEDPTPKSSPRRTGKNDESTRELAKINEILREESTHSDLLSQTELQLRLSSIKKKVEVRKRGRDSRSSFGSDLDSSFQDSMMDLTTERDIFNASSRTPKTTNTSRTSARANTTRISKQFQTMQE